MASTDKACCNISPVTTDAYTAKGTFTELAGLSIYVTGPDTATRGLIAIYDIFGMLPQTQQGADLLAHSLSAIVLMPDFFRGEPLPFSNFPADTNEKKKRAGDFLTAKADFKVNKAKVVEVLNEAMGVYGSVRSWGVYGLCWGGKVAALACAKETEFRVAGTAHPGRLAREDAEEITVPFICLFSKEDGTPELVQEYTEVLEKSKENVVEKYSTMHHGWMGARADLKNEENLKEYQRGYNQLASFFRKHL